MKKILLFAAVATMFAACTKDATKDLAPAKPTDTFYVSIGDDDSRVQLNEQMQTVWTEGDRVSVFNKTTDNRRYKFTGKTGDRTGELSYIRGGTTGDKIDQIVAVYPYNESNSITSDGTVSTVMPFVQTYRKDNFGIGGSIMVARSDDENLSFRNVMGWIRIALTGEKTILRITLQGNNKELIAGNATIGNDMSITPTADAKQVVILNCDVALSQDTPTYFYIAVPPQTFEKGISICMFDTDNKFMKFSTANNITVIRNHIIPMKPLVYDGKDSIPTNQIWYTYSNDYGFLAPRSYNGHIISHICESGIGVIIFDCPQTSIGDEAFMERTGLTSITIPNGVTSIGDIAFWGCKSLTSITIPDGVTEIGFGAFMLCTCLTSVTIPDGVTEIGKETFYGCSGLTSITIPDGVMGIGDSAFWCCSGLTSITIPDSVTEIGNSAFGYCSGLTSITIPDGVTEIGKETFYGCSGLTSITIPDGVMGIGDSAFWCCSGLTSITIPDSVTEIGNSAFGYCSGLTSITIPDGVTEIGKETFYGCSGLTSITIPDGVTEIGGGAFMSCKGLTSVIIPNSVKTIGDSAFSRCSTLTNITIGNNVTTIGDEAFSLCGRLKSVTIPDSVTTIGKIVFFGCPGLESIYGKYASEDNRCLIVDGNLIAFTRGAGLTEYTIPNGVKTIEKCVFWKSNSLTSITIPDSVTEIGSSVFEDCKSLTSVYCKATTPPTLDENVFKFYDSSNNSYNNIDCTIYVPRASVDAYKADSGWKEYASQIVGYDF